MFSRNIQYSFFFFLKLENITIFYTTVINSLIHIAQLLLR